MIGSLLDQLLDFCSGVVAVLQPIGQKLLASRVVLLSDLLAKHIYQLITPRIRSILAHRAPELKGLLPSTKGRNYERYGDLTVPKTALYVRASTLDEIKSRKAP